MKTTEKAETVYFSTKGQVVIPHHLRKEFEIQEGTRAVVYQEGDAIVLKPITRKRYDALMGCLKDTNAMKVFLEERKREREM